MVAASARVLSLKESRGPVWWSQCRPFFMQGSLLRHGRYVPPRAWGTLTRQAWGPRATFCYVRSVSKVVVFLCFFPDVQYMLALCSDSICGSTPGLKSPTQNKISKPKMASKLSLWEKHFRRPCRQARAGVSNPQHKSISSNSNLQIPNPFKISPSTPAHSAGPPQN